MAEKMGIVGWSTILATWVGIAGGGFGLFTAIKDNQEAAAKAQTLAEKEFQAQSEAWEKEMSGQKAQTLKMFEIFNGSEMLSAREKIYNYIQSTKDAEPKLTEILIYFDFFDALKICVENRLCDEDVAVRLFQGYAFDVWELETDIKQLRQEFDILFADGVEWMTNLPRPEAVAMAETAAEEEPAAAAPSPTPASAEAPASPAN